MGPLGFIEESKRTEAQHAAHHAAVGVMKQYTLPIPQLAKGDKFCLYDFWKNPKVIEGAGLTFDRIFQWTGSCVWAGGTNALFSTIAAQCVAGKSLAFMPFTLHNYAQSRAALGWMNPGEGSLGSTFAASLEKDGVENWRNQSLPLPKFSQTDGIRVASGDVEMTWSSVNRSPDEQILPTSREHLLGAATPAQSVSTLRALILNGYGASFACSKFIGNGSIVGGGGTPYVRGRWDSSGGHQQSVHAFWEHPNDGPLYGVLNNWPGNTYPIDPAGLPKCAVWVSESDVIDALRYEAEVFGLSNLNWFAPTPELMQWIY